MIDLITIADLDEWEVCGREGGGKYDDATLTRWLNGRDGWTPLEVASMRQVPAVDRLWVLLRPEVIGEDLYEEAGYTYADRAVRKYAVPHPATKGWAKRWLRERTTRREAASAAREAAWAPWAAWAAWAAWRAPWAPWAAWAAREAASAARESEPEQKWQLAWLLKKLLEADDE